MKELTIGKLIYTIIFVVYIRWLIKEFNNKDKIK